MRLMLNALDMPENAGLAHICFYTFRELMATKAGPRPLLCVLRLKLPCMSKGYMKRVALQYAPPSFPSGRHRHSMRTIRGRLKNYVWPEMCIRT